MNEQERNARIDAPVQAIRTEYAEEDAEAAGTDGRDRRVSDMINPVTTHSDQRLGVLFVHGEC
ncbi:MAG TPA: hypothetical protein VIW24_24090 [Aldersonia sp.]